MDIYIGNLPKGTRPTELKKLLKDSIKNVVFERVFAQAEALGRIDGNVDVQIIKRKKFRKHGYYRYGHINIQSQRLAPVALDAMVNTEIRGSKLEVREFVKRNPANDRRKPGWQDLPWNNRQRRKADRRED